MKQITPDRSGEKQNSAEFELLAQILPTKSKIFGEGFSPREGLSWPVMAHGRDLSVGQQWQ